MAAATAGDAPLPRVTLSFSRCLCPRLEADAWPFHTFAPSLTVGWGSTGGGVLTDANTKAVKRRRGLIFVFADSTLEKSLTTTHTGQGVD